MQRPKRRLPLPAVDPRHKVCDRALLAALAHVGLRPLTGDQGTVEPDQVSLVEVLLAQVAAVKRDVSVLTAMTPCPPGSIPNLRPVGRAWRTFPRPEVALMDRFNVEPGTAQRSPFAAALLLEDPTTANLAALNRRLDH